MTETAREAVARAIWLRRFPDEPWEKVNFYDRMDYLIDAEAAIAALDAYRDAHGWQIVPKEPTPEIKRAGVRCWSPEMDDQQSTGVDSSFDAYLEDMADGYRAMLAAAPKPPGE